MKELKITIRTVVSIVSELSQQKDEEIISAYAVKGEIVLEY